MKWKCSLRVDSCILEACQEQSKNCYSCKSIHVYIHKECYEELRSLDSYNLSSISSFVLII